MSLEAVLADEDWDYVSLQQASPFSGMYETYEASLPELIEYVKARLPKKTKLMLHQTWAYASTSKHSGFKNYNCNQLTMYQAIANAVKKAAKANKIKIVIPSGTAIQNARTSFMSLIPNSWLKWFTFHSSISERFSEMLPVRISVHGSTEFAGQ